MKKSVLFILLFPFFTQAQDSHLTVHGSAGNLYLTHKATPKENFYSIGRLYNVSPKEIAPYNNVTLEKGLSIGEEIKIPLKSNFLQAGSVASDETAVPLYHKTSAKETLYGVSTQYGKVSPATLKSWNNISGDAISPGQELIVGYLRVKKDLSALSRTGTNIPAVKETTVEASQQGTVKKEPSKPSVPVAVVPPVKEPVISAPPVSVKQTAQPVAVKNTPGAPDAGGGFFRNLYAATGAEEKGKAGVFKSTSGWTDGKYYCLHNKAAQNTIVKITNSATGKIIYAKVLDVMPDLKQNTELSLRLSNAAADALGAGSENFDCTISY